MMFRFPPCHPKGAGGEEDRVFAIAMPHGEFSVADIQQSTYCDDEGDSDDDGEKHVEGKAI